MYEVDDSQLPDRLQEEGLHLAVFKAEELPDEYISQLIQKSRQPHVQEFEGSEDAEGRFKDIAAFRAWAESKKRIVYLLLADRSSHTPDLAGICWFGERENPHAPGYDVTFGVRLYDEDAEKGWGKYLGKGLAVPFLKATHSDAKQYFPNKKIWLDYVKGNEAARHTYEKFGYHNIAEFDGRVAMGHDTVFATGEGESS